MVEYIISAVLAVDVIITLVLLSRVRVNRIVATKRGDIDPDAINAALAELLDRSRPSGGRVHIHDVEEVLRRRLT